MRILAATALLALGCVPGDAATLLRSGEHSDFSRIVIELPEVGNWSLERSKNSYVFSAETLTPPVNMDRVFNFIPRTRVNSVTYNTDNNTISFGMQCQDCVADAFEIRSGRVVIDFKEIVKGEGGPSVVAFNPNEAERKNTTSIRVSDQSVVDHLNFLIPFQRDYLPQLVNKAGDETLKRKSAPELFLIDTSRKFTQKADLREDIHELEINSILNEQMSEHQQFANLPQMASVHDQLNPEITFSGENEASAESTVCEKREKIPPLPLDIAYVDLADAYRRIFDAKDKAQNNDIVRLAEIQIALGFGHEALSTMRLLPETSDHVHRLSAISRLLAARKLSHSDIDHLENCDDVQTVWSFLASEETAALSESAADQIALDFLKLPYALRRRLAAQLIEKLASLDMDQNAYRILESARSVDNNTFQDPITRNTIATAARFFGGRNVPNDQAFTISANSGEIDGLILKLEQAVVNKLELTPADWDLVDSLLYQFRSDDRGRLLADLKLRISLARNDLKRAGEALDVLIENQANLEDFTLENAIMSVDSAGAEFSLLFLESYLTAWEGNVTLAAEGEGNSIPIEDWLATSFAHQEISNLTEIQSGRDTAKRVALEVEGAETKQENRIERISKLLNLTSPQ